MLNSSQLCRIPPLPPPLLFLLQDNIGVRVKHGRAQTAGMKKHPVVAPRPDVLAHYPFVDDLKRAQGGGVGAALRRGTPSTPLQNLAKREIK